MSKYVFGIDLGMEYSRIAYVDDKGVPRIIRNLEGESVTPSVVAFEDNVVIVGETAKEEAILRPGETISSVRKLMGKTDVAINYRGRNISPEEISSYILKKLADDASEQMGERVKDIVVTCPINFGETEKIATKRACELAGLNVLEIIGDSVAAVLYYGCTRDNNEKTVLIYNLGGGTFDVTIVKISYDKIKLVYSDEDRDLGGRNWDEKLMSYIANEIIEKIGNTEFDEYILQDLKYKVEYMKKKLSVKVQASAVFNILGEKIVVKVTREEFENITSDLLHKTLNKTDKAIEIAKSKGYNQIDEILLIGGSTRMPQVKKALSEKYGESKIKMFEPDEAVVKGAAIHAVNVYLNNQKTVKDGIFDEMGLNPENYKEDLKVDKSVMDIDDGVQKKIIADTQENFDVKVINEDKEKEVADMPTEKVKYTEDFLNKKKIEPQREKERFIKKQKELKKLKDEIKRFKEELLEDINSYLD